MANQFSLLRRRMMVLIHNVDYAHETLYRQGDLIFVLNPLNGKLAVAEIVTPVEGKAYVDTAKFGGTLVEVEIVLPSIGYSSIEMPVVNGRANIGNVFSVEGFTPLYNEMYGSLVRPAYVLRQKTKEALNQPIFDATPDTIAIRCGNGLIYVPNELFGINGNLSKPDIVIPKVTQYSVEQNVLEGMAVAVRYIWSQGLLPLDNGSFDGTLGTPDEVLRRASKLFVSHILNGSAAANHGEHGNGSVQFRIDSNGNLGTANHVFGRNSSIPFDIPVDGTAATTIGNGLNANLEYCVSLSGFLEILASKTEGHMTVEDAALLGCAILTSAMVRDATIENRISILGCAILASAMIRDATIENHISVLGSATGENGLGDQAGEIKISDAALAKLEEAYRYTAATNEAGGLSYEITADEEIIKIDGSSVVIGGA